MLDVSIVERGESFYNSMIPDVLDDLVKKSIAVQNEGALCIFQNPDDPPLICKKSDGGFNYASTDLAAIRQVCFIFYLFSIAQNIHRNLFAPGILAHNGSPR